MGRLIQFQTSAVNMTLSLREQLRRQMLCITEEFPSPFGNLIISDLKWLHGSVRALEDEKQFVTYRLPFNEGYLVDNSITGKIVQIVQPIRVSLSTVPQLTEAGLNKPAIAESRELQLIFILRVFDSDDNVFLSISLQKLKDSPPEYRPSISCDRRSVDCFRHGAFRLISRSLSVSTANRK